MFKKYRMFISFCMIAVLYPLNGFARGKAENIPEGKITVAATFDAMYELAKVVGQDKVYIRTIIPAGMEPHDFEPKAGDLTFLSKAQIIIANGLDMEPWLEDALHAIKNENIMKIIATESITPIKLDENHHGHEHETCDGSCEDNYHGCGHHGEYDPHAWLSLESAKIMVKNIAAGLAKVDTVHAEFYQNNADIFIKEADNLLKKYRTLFSKIEHKHFVTGHAAFGYLCRDFGLTQNSVEDIFSSGEPSAKQLIKLTDYCNHNGIKTVFTETMASPQVSETLAKEVGAEVQTIYTIEAAEDGLSYMDRMKWNIERIYKSFIK